ncbi:hypothetical protein [Mycolicibacterium mageritense]|uniref:hypothetical protein n=1 Tax=Mycolicibacterium mageritense TaxID=53462 RepID=UPI001E54C413|nr:hypothetical protein [Mycolicibacterium mageritense]
MATPAGTNVGPAAAAAPPPPDDACGTDAAAGTEAGVVDTPPGVEGAPNPGDGNNIPPAPGAPLDTGATGGAGT